MEATARRVTIYDPVTDRVTRRIALPGTPGGMAFSSRGDTLYVTHKDPAGAVWVIDTRALRPLEVGIRCLHGGDSAATVASLAKGGRRRGR